MKEYLKSQIKNNQAIISDKFSNDELERFSKSDYRWVDNREKQYQHRTVKKGEIYQFEFGKNYQPEMSYEHRGLIIGVKHKLLYVLPIFSYNPLKHKEVYHMIDFPNSKSDMFLLKNSDFSFIKHDSILKLNDIRTVSINRILYKQEGIIPINSDIYKKIEELVIEKVFSDYAFNYKKIKTKMDEYIKLLDQKESNEHTLILENKKLKDQIEVLKNYALK